MARKKVTTRDKVSLVHTDIVTDKILEFLKQYKTKKHTQSNIATGIHMSVSTVSREIKKMVGKTYEKNQQSYTVCQGKNEKTNIYYVIHKNKDGNIVNSFKDPNRIFYFAEKIAKKYIWKNKKAIIVNRLVVLYEINKRYQSMIQPILYEMCNDSIIDIVPCEKGIYIILKEDQNLKNAKKDICDLYKTAVEISK